MKEIHALMTQIQKVEFLHILREGNSAVDFIAANIVDSKILQRVGDLISRNSLVRDLASCKDQLVFFTLSFQRVVEFVRIIWMDDLGTSLL